MIEIKELDKSLIYQANMNSMGGTRGDGSESRYKNYAAEIEGWKISDAKKQKLLDKLYDKWSELLSHEARHVSVMVAGPAKYNAKRLDHSDKVLELSAGIENWMDGLREQIEDSGREDDKLKEAVDMVRFADKPGNEVFAHHIPNELMKVATEDVDKFVELYEELYPKYKWRKNSNVAKWYEKAKAGELKAAKKDVFFEDENFTAYRKGDRAFIKFVMKPQRQLIVALKSRGWFWNNQVDAWSTYLDRVDEEWVKGISSQYEKYL